jgi:carboxymethylenebutenolidase
LDEHDIAYSLNMYPGTSHGFHNDSSEARYDPEAAALAWQCSLNLFETTLRTRRN